MGSSIRVVCAGDDITGGRHGISYVKLLNRRPITATPTFIPAGGGGDLAYHLAQRVDRIIELQPDVVTVLIGTNDARAVLSDNNARAVMVRKRLPSCPTLCRYERYVSEIVERLVADTNAQIALLSPPVLGQELGSSPVLSAGAHSRVVYEIAAAYRIAYLPLFERQCEHLQSHGSHPTIAFRDDARLVYRSMLRRWVCGQSYDDISRQRGLQLTTDFVHQNSCGAAIIADLIEDFLKTRVTWKPQLCK